MDTRKKSGATIVEQKPEYLHDDGDDRITEVSERVLTRTQENIKRLRTKGHGTALPYIY